MKQPPLEYPLCWPEGFPRTENKTSSKFKTGLKTALNNVKRSMDRFGKESGTPTENIVISSNVTLSNDKPDDTGVAVWFEWEGKQLCIAVDRYPKVEDNVQAIHHIIEGRLTELRHGGLHILRQTFAGFKGKLIAQTATGISHFTILDMEPTRDKEKILSRWKELAKKYRDDPNKMRDINIAKDEAIKSLNNLIS